MKIVLSILTLVFISVGAYGAWDASQMPCRVTTQKDVTVTTSSPVPFFNANGSRRCLECQNKDTTNPVYVNFDSAPLGNANAFKIPGAAGGTFWSPKNAPTNQIWMSSTGGNATVNCYEGTYP